MKKILLLLASIVTLFSLTGCVNNSVKEGNKIDKSKPTIFVSIVPEATFAKKVGGDLINVVTMIPPGNSPANYQPSPIQMQNLSEASIYFAINVPTEEANILPKIKDFNKDIKIINLRNEVSKNYDNIGMKEHDHEHEDEHGHEDEHEDHGHEENLKLDEEGKMTIDPHIWLSPKRAIVITNIIKDELVLLDPDNKDVYESNAASYIKKLEDLDTEIEEIANSLENKKFFIYHGAYGYFADDYDLTMISLEVDGKAATAERMQSVIKEAKEENVKTIFYQSEFDDSQAATVAEEINGSVVKTSPLSPDYIKNLKEFIKAIQKSEEK